MHLKTFDMIRASLREGIPVEKIARIVRCEEWQIIEIIKGRYATRKNSVVLKKKRKPAKPTRVCKPKYVPTPQEIERKCRQLRSAKLKELESEQSYWTPKLIDCSSEVYPYLVEADESQFLDDNLELPRPFKLSVEQKKLAAELYASKKYTLGKLAKRFGVSHGAIRQAIRDNRYWNNKRKDQNASQGMNA